MKKLLDPVSFVSAAGAAALGVVLWAAVLWLPVERVKAQPLSLVPQIFALTVGTGATMNAVASNPNVRSIIICNGNATAANVVTATWGSAVTPVDGTTGLVIPGGQVVASCWTSPAIGGGNFWGMQQLNLIAHVGATPVTVLIF